MTRVSNLLAMLGLAAFLVSCESTRGPGTAPVGLSDLSSTTNNTFPKLEARWENLPPEEKKLRQTAKEFLLLNNFDLSLNSLIKEIVVPYRKALPDVPRSWFDDFVKTKVDQTGAQDGLIEAALDEFNLAELDELLAYAKTPTGTKFRNNARKMRELQYKHVAQWKFEMLDKLEVELRRQRYLQDLSRLRIDDGGPNRKPDPPPATPPGLTPEQEQELRFAARKFLELTGVDLSMSKEINEVLNEYRPRAESVPDAWWNVYVTTKMTVEKIQSHLIQVLISQFTTEELNDLNAFYETPTGQKFRDRLPIMSQNHVIQNGLWAREVKNDLARALRKEGFLR